MACDWDRRTGCPLRFGLNIEPAKAVFFASQEAHPFAERPVLGELLIVLRRLFPCSGNFQKPEPIDVSLAIALFWTLLALAWMRERSGGEEDKHGCGGCWKLAETLHLLS